jgi:2-methylfumaryl-CoA hydratase
LPPSPDPPSPLRAPRYGRLLDDFVPGAVYEHPWEVTVDAGMVGLFAASFQDATPTWASRLAAADVGFADRPLSPLLLLNLGLSFSVHDVSEQAIAHLAYIDVRFPAAAFVGDTVRARSRVLGVKRVSSRDKGVVHVRTDLENQDGVVVCTFERKALVRTGHAADRPADLGDPARPPPTPPEPEEAALRVPPSVLAALELAPRRRHGFSTFWDDLQVGDVFAHSNGRTVTETEHVQLATLLRNSHPLHVDERWSRQASFAKARVVYGGLVLAWVVALGSRDLSGNGIWELGLDEGAHPSGVLAGDTLYAASRVEAKEAIGAHAGSVTLRIVGVKNVPARAQLEAGADLFTPELGKADAKVPEKVVEMTRTVLLWRRPR